MTLDEEGFWYVAHTKPRQEEVAEDHLGRQGYDVYLPRLKVGRLLRRRFQLRVDPLFPRYIFFRPRSTKQSIAPVCWTTGVSTVVRFGGMPARMEPDRLEEIRAFEVHQNAATLESLTDLRPGKRVLVTDGPLAGIEGLVSMVSRQRVVVLMRMLSASTQVTLRANQLSIVA